MSRVNPLWTAQLNNWCMCQCIKRMMKRKASYSATVWGIRTSTPHSGVQWTIIEHKLPKHSTEILHICTGRKGVVTSPWTKIGVVKLFRLELPPLFFQKSIIFPSKLPQKPQHNFLDRKWHLSPKCQIFCEGKVSTLGGSKIIAVLLVLGGCYWVPAVWLVFGPLFASFNFAVQRGHHSSISMLEITR